MSILLQTRDLQVADVRVPGLKIVEGDWIVLGWPSKFGSESESLLYASLLSAGRRDLGPFSGVSVALPVGHSLNFVNTGENSPDLEHLLRTLPHEERGFLTAELENRGVPLHSPANYLPMTLRLLLGLCVASSRSKVIVFNVAGIDPLGVQKIYEYVSAKTRQGFGFIELVFSGDRGEQTRPSGARRFDAFKMN